VHFVNVQLRQPEILVPIVADPLSNNIPCHEIKFFDVAVISVDELRFESLVATVRTISPALMPVNCVHNGSPIIDIVDAAEAIPSVIAPR
jgi:hypothetical protein